MRRINDTEPRGSFHQYDAIRKKCTHMFPNNVYINDKLLIR